MKRKSVATVSFALIIAAMSASYALGSPKASSKPQIAGVLIGDAAPVVLRTLADDGIMYKTKYMPCLSQYVAGRNRAQPLQGAGSCVSSIESPYHGGTLRIDLVEDVPRRPNVMIVSSISLSSPNDSSIVKRIVARAGPPQATDHKTPWTWAVWCFSTHCGDTSNAIGNPLAGEIMLINEGGVTIIDQNLITQRERYRNAVLSKYGVRLVD